MLPSFCRTRVSKAAGPRPMVWLKPFFISTLKTIGRWSGCSWCQAAMLSRQLPRSWLRLLPYSSPGVFAASQLLSLPSGLLWLTRQRRVNGSV